MIIVCYLICFVIHLHSSILYVRVSYKNLGFSFKGEEKRKKKNKAMGKFRGNNMMCFEKGTLGWVLTPLLNKLKGGINHTGSKGKEKGGPKEKER